MKINPELPNSKLSSDANPKLDRDNPMAVTPNQDEIAKLYGGLSSTAPTPVSDRTQGVIEAPQQTPQAPKSPDRLPEQPKTTKNNSGNWSTAVSTLLDQPPATLPLRLILGGLVFCLAFVAWAWFGQIEEVGKAQGKLVPQGETYKIQPVGSGKVIDIDVKEGEEVKKGDIIAELDPEIAQKDIQQLQETLNNYQSQIAQKQTLLKKVTLEAETSAAISSAQVLAQRSAIALAKEKAITARRLLEQQLSEIASYQNRTNNLAPLSNTAQEAIEQLKQQETEYKQRLERLNPLVEQGAISQDQIFQAKQSLSEVQQRIIQARLQEINSANEQIFQGNRDLQEINSRITQSRGDVASANREIEQVQAQLAQQQAEGARVQIEAQQKAKQLEVEITDLQGKIATTRTQIASAETKLRENYLKAPVDGVITSLVLTNTGEIVEPGKTVAEIAPLETPLVLSAVIPNSEAGFIKKGMPVNVKLDAYPYQDFGVINGTVNSISADAKPDEKLGQVYRVEIKLDRDYVNNNNQKIEFKPGQTATADIIIRRRRIADVLLEPLKQLQKDGVSL